MLIISILLAIIYFLYNSYQFIYISYDKILESVYINLSVSIICFYMEPKIPNFLMEYNQSGSFRQSYDKIIQEKDSIISPLTEPLFWMFTSSFISLLLLLIKYILLSKVKKIEFKSKESSFQQSSSVVK